MKFSLSALSAFYLTTLAEGDFPTPEHRRKSRVGQNAASPLRRGGARGAGWRTTSPTMHASARSPDWLRRSSSVTSGRGGAVAAGWVSRSWGPAAAMNFSEAFKLSSLLCKFSPDGKYLVSGRGAWAEGGPSAGRRLSSPGGGDRSNSFVFAERIF